MEKEYKTVLCEAADEIEEKKSRFIATVKPIKTEEEAIEFINSLKSKYWNARHNVYAYSLGGNTIIQRYSDDGEPSGTAGMPIIEVIKRMGVENLVVVVTRYFGGILLGASGLIRAYSKSASLGIEAAQIVVKKLCVEIIIITEYTMFGKIRNLIMVNDYPIKDIKYEQDVEITVYIGVSDKQDFVDLITDVSNGQVLIEIGKKGYITLDKNEKMIKERGFDYVGRNDA